MTTDRSVGSTAVDTSPVTSCWKQVGDRRVLWFQAMSPDIDVNVWTVSLSRHLAGCDSEEIRLLSDTRKTTAIGNAGFYTDIVKVLTANRIKFVKFALVSPDFGRKILVQLFQSIAKESGVDVDVEVFVRLEDAERWILR